MQSRVSSLDALRAVAILGVIAVHTEDFFIPPPWVAKIATQGALGVQLFFMLSAVTLMLSWRARAHHEIHPVASFYVRRIFRIGPMFWLGILVFLLVDPPGRSFWAPEGIPGWHVILTALFLHGFYPASINDVVPGGWSIAVEMTFYVIFPLVAAFCTTLGRAAALTAFLLVSWTITNHELRTILLPYMTLQQEAYTKYWFPAQAWVFALGICVYFIIRSVQSKPASLPSVAALVVIITAFIGLCLIPIFPARLPAMILLLAMFIIVVALRPPRVLVNVATGFIGRVSFSAYLLHFLVLSVVERLWAPPLPVSPILFAFACFCVAGITIALSTLTYHFVERPGIQLGNWLLRKRSSDVPRPVT